MPLSEPFKVWIGHPLNWCLIDTEDMYFLFLRDSSHLDLEMLLSFRYLGLFSSGV